MLFTPIVVLGIRLSIWPGGIEIVAFRMFDPGTNVEVIVLPRIFRHFLVESMPARRPWIGIGLRNKRPQSLCGCRVKPIHAFVELQLGADTLNIGGDSNLSGTFTNGSAAICLRAEQTTENDRRAEVPVKTRPTDQWQQPDNRKLDIIMRTVAKWINE